MASFDHRGVVEGFYGVPWAHQDRLWLIEKIGGWGMNCYVYAPKDDALNRDRWREPYRSAQLAEFKELIGAGERVGVRVGFAISPGLSICYSDREDRDKLIRKFSDFYDMGARMLTLALDDCPSEFEHPEDSRLFESLAHAHADLARELSERFPDATWWLVPLDYLGTEETAYLKALGAELPSGIEVAWTGRTVVSPTIEAGEAAQRAGTLGRRLLLWDNVPVSDGPMRSMLHLGPYGGRDPGLAEHCSGVLLNPMQQARASTVAIRTAADYFAKPAQYDPEAAWLDALRELGAAAQDALICFAQAHRFSPTWSDARDRGLEQGFAQLASAIEAGGDIAPAIDQLAGQLGERSQVSAQLRANLTDRRLCAELEPWLESHLDQTLRMQAAVDAARALLGAGTARERVLSYLTMQSTLASHRPSEKTSYGPRRVVYPQLAALGNDSMSFGADRALFRGRNLADELVEFVEDLAVWLLGSP